MVDLSMGAKAKILGGNFRNKQGVVSKQNINPLILDASTSESYTLFEKIPKQKVVIVYVYDGEIEIDSKKIATKQLAILGEGDEIEISSSKAGYLILSGEPTGEPIARSGPFVMNTQEELMQAFKELRNGSFIKSA